MGGGGAIYGSPALEEDDFTLRHRGSQQERERERGGGREREGEGGGLLVDCLTSQQHVRVSQGRREGGGGGGGVRGCRQRERE